MEDLSEEENQQRRPDTVIDKITQQERTIKHLKRLIKSKEEDTNFKVPNSWKSAFKKSKSKSTEGKVLCEYYNQKYEIEGPKWVPIHEGNIIIWKNKSYKYDPESVWRRKIKGYPMTYQIREIDRLPISNKDYSQIRGTDRSPEDDPILLKMLLQAKLAQVAKKVNYMVMVIVGVVIIGGLIWFLWKG